MLWRALTFITRWWLTGFTLTDADFNGALPHAQITQFQIIWVIPHQNWFPAIHFFIAQFALECCTTSLTFESLPLYCQTSFWSDYLGNRHIRFMRIIDLMGQGPGGTGQDALQAITGKIAGLSTGVDIWCSNAEALIQFCQLDGIHRTDLHALTTFDTCGQILLFQQGTGGTQAYHPLFQHWDKTQQRGADESCSEGDAANKFAACTLRYGTTLFIG